MKANTPKRKIFDAVHLLTEDNFGADGGSGRSGDFARGFHHSFHNHPFRLYEGERLDDMVKSVQEHGILASVVEA